MKRQDDSGCRLAVDSVGSGAATDVNITSVGGTPVTSPLPVTGVVTGNVTVVQPTGTNLHVVTDATSTTIATQATGTNLHTVVDSGTLTTVSTVTAVTAITNALPAGTNLLGKVSASDETSTIYSGTTAVTPKFAKISASGNGDNTVVVAGTNKIRVLGWNLVSSGTVNVKWQSGAGGTDLTGLYYLIANTGISVAYSPVGWFETASATLLNLNLSAGVPVGGNICYIDVA